MRRKSLVGILVVLLAVAALLVGRSSQQPASADPFQLNNNLGLLPAEATVLFGLDLDGLLSSAAFATVRARAEEAMNDPGYRSFKADTGLDVLRDFKGVTGAIWSLPGGKMPDSVRGLVVVTAEYDRSKISALLGKKSNVPELCRDFEIWMIEKEPPESKSESVTAVLLDDRTILLGTASAVKQSLDLKLGPGPSVLNNGELVEQLQKLGSENQLWAVALAPGDLLKTAGRPPPGQANVFQLLQRIEATTFALKVTSGLRLLLEGTFGNEQDAGTLNDLARGFLATMRLGAPSDRPEPLELLNTLDVQQEASAVRITVDIPQELLEKLAANPESFSPSSPSRKRPRREKDREKDQEKD